MNYSISNCKETQQALLRKKSEMYLFLTAYLRMVKI